MCSLLKPVVFHWDKWLGPQEGFWKIVGLFSIVIMISGGATGIWCVCKAVPYNKNGPLAPPHPPICWKDLDVGEKAVYDYLSLRPNCVVNINTKIFVFWHGFSIQWLFRENYKVNCKYNLRQYCSLFGLKSSLPWQKIASRVESCLSCVSQNARLYPPAFVFLTFVQFPCVGASKEPLYVSSGCAWTYIVHRTLLCYLLHFSLLLQLGHYVELTMCVRGSGFLKVCV